MKLAKWRMLHECVWKPYVFSSLFLNGSSCCLLCHEWFLICFSGTMAFLKQLGLMFFFPIFQSVTFSLCSPYFFFSRREFYVEFDAHAQEIMYTNNIICCFSTSTYYWNDSNGFKYGASVDEIHNYFGWELHLVLKGKIQVVRGECDWVGILVGTVLF